jgi:hypothetical protein
MSGIISFGHRRGIAELQLDSSKIFWRLPLAKSVL